MTPITWYTRTVTVSLGWLACASPILFWNRSNIVSVCEQSWFCTCGTREDWRLYFVHSQSVTAMLYTDITNTVIRKIQFCEGLKASEDAEHMVDEISGDLTRLTFKASTRCHAPVEPRSFWHRFSVVSDYGDRWFGTTGTYESWKSHGVYTQHFTEMRWSNFIDDSLGQWQSGECLHVNREEKSSI